MLLTRRGQTSAEYAITFAVILGVLAVMQIYVRRSAVSRFKGAADQIGEQLTPGGYKVSSNVKRDESTAPTGQSSSVIVGNEIQKRELQ